MFLRRIAIILLLVVVAGASAWFAYRARASRLTVVPATSRLTIRVSRFAAEPLPPVVEPRWGRAKATYESEYWPPNRGDWSENPRQWQLRPVATVSEIPPTVRQRLRMRDCRIPVGTPEWGISLAVVWGELRRDGERDLAVLCVHQDLTSAIYVFWGGDADQQEVLPESGNQIGVVRPAAIGAQLDLSRPIDADMPTAVEHDGLLVACCECCSTTFYHHKGRWFTLAGPD